MLRILIFILLLVIPASAKEYSGSAWVDDVCKYYNGSAWVDCTKNHYNGSAWAEIEAPAGGETVSYASTSTAVYDDATQSVTVTPSAGNIGDLLVASCINDDDQPVLGFSGFTSITSVLSSSSSLEVGYLVDAGATNYTFSYTSYNKVSCSIARITKSGGSWNIQASGTQAATATSINIPSVTADQDASMLFVAVGNDDPGDITTAPAGMTETTHYSATDPVLYSWYQAVDTGLQSGKSATAASSGDLSAIAIIIEAQ